VLLWRCAWFLWQSSTRSLAAKGPARRRKILSAYRIASAAFVLVLAVAGVSLSPVLLIALVAVACALQVVLDLLGSSQAGPEAKADEISD
jgi:hypothetical protein